MFLKVITTFLLAIGIALVLAAPVILRQQTGYSEIAHSRPGSAAIQATFLGYYGSTLCLFLSVACFAMVLARQAREEYQEAMRKNVEALVEGAVHDARSKSIPNS